MTEEILAIFPASEIWGINRRTPCHIILSDERIVVVKGERARKGWRALPTLKKVDLSSGMEAFLEGDHYSLPYERVRWVEVREFLTSALLKIGTPGSGYRFRLRKRPATKMKQQLRELLGDLVRERGR